MKLTKMKEETDKPTYTFGDFNTSLLVIDRSAVKKSCNTIEHLNN